MTLEMDTESPYSPAPYKPHKRKTKKSFAAQTIFEQTNKSPPTAGYHPTGFNPITRNPNNPPLIRTYRNEKKPKRVELVIKPQNANSNMVDYVGSNYSGEAAAGKLANYAIAIVDEAARKFILAPLASSRVFRLNPKVRALEESEVEPVTPAKPELTREERYKKMNDLTALYGTGDAVKKAKKMQLLRQEENPDLREEFNQILGETPADKAAIDATNTDINSNIPPYDINATTPEEAYPLDRIISKGEWDYLMDILELLQAEKELKADAYPSFVCNRFYKMELVKDETEKRKIGGILSYITHLIHFKDKHSFDSYSSSKHHKIPSMLHQKFTTMFSNSHNDRLSDEKLGALISCVLVLTLHVDEFLTDFRDIAKDLKVTEQKLRPYFENLGCKFRSRDKVAVATLPVPLKFPTARRMKRRRGV